MSDPSLAHMRVLVVDDEPANRRLLRAILAPEGLAIIDATNGVEALEIIEREPIDLVLLDVMMPVLDGIEVCRRIRARESYIPVILVTALADSESRVRGKEVGADDFLTKPVHEDELTVRVRNLLRLRAFHTEAVSQRREAEKNSERWRLMSEVAAAVATCRDHGELLQALMDALAGPLPLDCCGILDVQPEAMVVRATCGHVPPGGGRAPTVPIDATDRASLARLRSVGHARLGPKHETLLAPLLRELGFRDAVAIPVEGAGDLHQVFVAARHGAFSDEEIGCLSRLAPHIGNAVNNVRLHVRAEQLLRMRDELSQLLVHDLRNLAATAMINTDLASEIVDDPEGSELLAEARGSLARLSSMISELLDVGAAEEGRLRVSAAPTDLGQLAREVVAQMAAPQCRLGLARITIDEAPVIAAVDSSLIRRVLENVVGNASRFVPPDGMIDVHIARKGDHVVLSVANDGPTLDAAIRSRLFTKYTGADPTARRSVTRGLGLYFCKLVVEAHAGTIEAVNVTAGARFEIRLPLGEAPPRVADASVAPTPLAV